MSGALNLNRPKPTDNEECLLQMQEDFLKSQQQPSVKVAIKSKFAQQKESSQKGISTSSSGGEMLNPSSVVNLDTLNISTQKNDKERIDVIQNIPNIILGNIVERKFNAMQKYEFRAPSTHFENGFPQVFVSKDMKSNDKKSLFLQKVREKQTDDIDVTKSTIVQGPWAQEIHQSNLEKLSQMSTKEILDSKMKLEKALSPDLVEFLKSRRKRVLEENKMECKMMESTSTENKSRKIDNVDKKEKMEVDDDQEKKVDDLPKPLEKIFVEAKEKGWVHMDALEPEKLKWAQDLSVEDNSKGPDEPYNARFDFDGILQPYKDDTVLVTKGLHHHGEEPNRPGYTLQELIQLSRSSTQQQRCTALSTLANIMANSRRGWYDKALQPAPLCALNEKSIFLLLRFSLDDTAMPIVTSALRALREFLVSEADELCLDRVFGLIDGFQEPTLIPESNDIDINDLKDDELAQIDTVAAAMRSDIVLRIRYILSEMRPPPVGVNAALHILIKLARRSRETALNIATTANLLKIIVVNFVPFSANQLATSESKSNAYGVPIVAALRLCRILLTYAGRPVADRLQNLRIVNSLVSYISSDAGENSMELKIESLRLWKILVSFGVAPDSISGISFTLLTQLKLLLSNHDLDKASELACEYAGALVSIAAYDEVLKTNVTPLLEKWSTQLARLATPTWTRTKLVAQTIMALDNISAMRMSWISNFKIFENVRSSSNLLSTFTTSSNREPPSLPSLGVLMESGELQPSVSRDSCIPFLAIVLNFLLKSSSPQNPVINTILENLFPYLQDLEKFEWSLERSWYTRAELFLLSQVVHAEKLISREKITKITISNVIWKLSLELISTLSSDRQEEVKMALEYAFSHEKFKTELVLGQMKSLGIDGISGFELPSDFFKRYERFLSKKGFWTEAAMPKDWLYLPIVSIYSKIKDGKSGKIKSEDDVMNVKVFLSLESAVPQLVTRLSANIRFSRLCLIFMCDDIYCDNSVTPLLVQVITGFFKNNYKMLDFSASVPGLNSFTDLFTALCENFLAHSFGDDHFVMMLLTFVMQRHDVHYRKSLWSEHAYVLRYCAISPEKLYYPLTEFLYPLETDVSLIECYITALVRRTVRPSWCPMIHIIATHHAAMYLKNTTKLAQKMRAAIEKLNDRDLANNLLNYQSPF